MLRCRMTCTVRVSQLVIGVGLLLAARCASVEDKLPGEELGTSSADPPATVDPPSQAAVDDAPTQRAASRVGYTATRYPIVLAHGAGGFKSLFGVLEYFHGIAGALSDGGAEIYVTTVSALSSSDER